MGECRFGCKASKPVSILRGASTSSRKQDAVLEFAGGVEFWMTRKRVKNINIHIKPPDGRVEVSAPLNVPVEKVRKFVQSKEGWIARTKESVIASPSSLAEFATEDQKVQWKEVVSACVPPLVSEWEPILGVKAGNLAYRNMTSRWGSCQPSTGRICINTRLALYPPECLEYVVVHELCHLLVRGHGPEFHKLMDSVMPDWRTRRKLLR